MPTAHCEWGLHGIESLRDHVKVLIIVDVLSFSTAVDIAVARGAVVLPYPIGDEQASARAAADAGAVLASPKRADGGQYSLSPVSLQEIPADTKLLLPSPNGSILSLAGGGAIVFSGCLRNRRAVAKMAKRAADGGDIAVIPAGERWPDDSLRPAIEDLLGAGAILDALDMKLTAEAQLARDAFRKDRSKLATLIRESKSGQELIGRGFARDVELAVELDISRAAPRLSDGRYAMSGSPLPRFRD
jgi:2-phosphosulfolactate phosphatase